MSEISLVLPDVATDNGKSMRVAVVESLAGRLVIVYVAASAPATVFVAGYAIAKDAMYLTVVAADGADRGVRYEIDFESINGVKVL